jgi:hypothetical protein
MIIFANDLPYTGPQMDPIGALKNTIAFSADDWSVSRAMAWVYGIVLGWDNDDPDDPDEGAMGEIAARFGWTLDQVARLRKLHVRFEELS